MSSIKKQSKEVCAIIGMRSGSKGIKDKNIRLLGGKPLVHWIIEAAKHASYVNRIVISTDSRQYATLLNSCNVSIPFLRPKEISRDDSTDYQYISHCLKWLKDNENYQPDIVVRLLPTTPLQSSQDIDLCVSTLIKNDWADSCVAISESRQHPEKALKIQKKNNSFKISSYLDDSIEPKPRQKKTRSFHRSNIIAARTESILNSRTLTGSNSVASFVDINRSIDIDTEFDFKIASYLIGDNNG